MHRYTGVPLLPILALGAALGCSRAEAPGASPYAPPPPAAAPALKVIDVEVGRALDADKKISDKTDAFKPADTIYVSVATEGSSPGAALVAHWTYKDGQVVKHDETTIAPSGNAVTEFHIVKPSGWPVGDYKVEVMLNGASAGTKSFKVER
jgi:hypothetical protein